VLAWLLYCLFKTGIKTCDVYLFLVSIDFDAEMLGYASYFYALKYNCGA